MAEPRNDHGRPRLVLASASPARATLLRSAGVTPLIRTSRVDEEALIATYGPRAGDPDWVTQQLARAKALDVVATLRAEHFTTDSGHGMGSAGRRALVIGADSMLSFADQVLGKAATAEEVRRRWAAMAGRTGSLVTGHTLVDLATGDRAEATVATTIRFGRPDPVELEAYIATGEPLAVAGSCTIDGLGGPFIAGIDGDHTNVVGLSLPTLRDLAAQLGVRWTDLWAST